MSLAEIKDRIPQREPFLFIDKIINRTDKSVQVSYDVQSDSDFFKGHFPGNPIMPGVLLSEACFQSGALLMSYLIDGGLKDKTAVVSRIQNAKFKNMVRPGDTIDINTSLIEQLDSAAYLKSTITSNGKKSLIIEFAVTIVSSDA